MKTERRHELQTNVLADWLGKKIEGFQPYFKVIQPYFKSIVAVSLLLLAAIFAFMVLNGSQSSRQGASWAEFMSAFGQRDADLLDRVADSNEGTTAGLWAKQAMADIQLADGTSQLYMDRDAAAEALDDAAAAYKEVVDQAGKHPMLRRRAMFGLAQANECLSVLTKNKGKNQEFLDIARKNYEQLAKDAAGTVLGRMAAKRFELVTDLAGPLQSTDDGATDESNWYLWLASQEMPPPSLGQGMPGDFGTGGGTPRVGANTMPGFASRPPLPPIPSLDPPFPLEDESPAPETPDNPEPADSPEPADEKADSDLGDTNSKGD